MKLCTLEVLQLLRKTNADTDIRGMTLSMNALYAYERFDDHTVIENQRIKIRISYVILLSEFSKFLEIHCNAHQFIGKLTECMNMSIKLSVEIRCTEYFKEIFWEITKSLWKLKPIYQQSVFYIFSMFKESFAS